MSDGKRMAIAIGLSAIILFIYMFYQSRSIRQTSQNISANTNIALNQTNDNEKNINITLNTSSMQKIDYNETAELNNEIQILENEYVIAKLRNGALYSYELKNYYKQDIPKNATNEIVDMVGQIYNEIYPFTLTFQNLSNSIAVPENLNYNAIETNNETINYIAEAVI